MREISRIDGMPAVSNIMRWIAEDEKLQEQYARAKEIGIEAMAADLLAIANKTQIGVIKTIKPDGTVEEKHADMIEHRRLQVDARKWLLSKLAPKKYGDKVAIGGDPENPVQHSVTVVFK